jgi:putative tricarboxylic transport membrane protein
VKRETVICGFWLLFSFYLSVESYRLGLSSANRPGPGFFPFIAAVGIGLIAALRLLASVRASASAENPDLGIAGEAKLVFYVIAGMTAYAFLLEPLGFLLCTLLLVGFYLKAIAGRGWPVTLAFAIAVALTSHVFFDVLLRAELPRGVLDWLM